MRPDSDEHYCLQWCGRMRWVCVRNATGRDCNWVLARRLGLIVPGPAGSWGEYQHKLVEAQEQVDAAMAEASVARDFLRDVIVKNAREITEDAIDVTEMEVDSEIRWPNMKRYSPTTLFRYINAFCKGRGKWAQHAKDILNMTPLRYLLIGFVIVFLRETLFTKKKWAQAVDVNHGLNLGGIEVIRNMEGTKKGAMGLV
jgi:hypothetical protein